MQWEALHPGSSHLDFANPLDYHPSDYSGIAVLHLPKKATPEDFQQVIKTFAKGLENNQLIGKLWMDGGGGPHPSLSARR